MFDLEELLENISPLTRQPDKPTQIASSTVKQVSGGQPDRYPTNPTPAPAHLSDLSSGKQKAPVGCLPDNPPDKPQVSGSHPTSHPTAQKAVRDANSTISALPPVGFVGLVSGKEPNTQNIVRDGIIDDLSGCRVGSGMCVDESTRQTLTRRLLEAGSALGWSKVSLEGWQDWATGAPLQALTERVENTERRLSLRRDSDLEGCPVHWWPVPLLPPKGSQVALVEDGYGGMYRFKVNGRWYLVKFLPPFDGRLSLTDEDGVVRVLRSLEEVVRFLGTLESTSPSDTRLLYQGM